MMMSFLLRRLRAIKQCHFWPENIAACMIIGCNLVFVV